MALVDINLIPDSSGGSFDFKNDSGAAIPAGSLFVQGELTGYISTQVGDTPSVEPEDLGTFRFAGASQIFTAPLDPLAALTIMQSASGYRFSLVKSFLLEPVLKF
jgi:hypothetical protein